MEGWLSLKVSEKPASGKQSSHRSILISVPKKAVRLATRRNRLKRLIREALKDRKKLSREKVYAFRVRFEPGDMGLKLSGVENIVTQLLKDNV